MRSRIVIALLGWAGLAASAPAGGAKQEPEELPPPKMVAPAPAVQVVPEFYPVFPEPPPRLDSRNAWIYFAPNSMGQMRLRVIQAPYGSYYLYNGEPYYGLQTRSPYILPRTTN